ncbi:MAG TPA: sensor domain-containing diguanylate cyclase [Calditrichaeota bacterium]|nr:sensor domain-containing diguanylate cyclase [Calditrichota bacterium]
MLVKIKKSLTNCLHDMLPILTDINALQSVERIFHRIVEQIVKDLQCTTCAIIEINPESELLEIRNSHNLSWKFIKNYHRPIKGTMLHELIWNGTPIVINERTFAKTFAEEIQLERDFVSAYAVPLGANHRPLGLLYCDSDEPSHFDAGLQLMCKLYAQIISNVILLERITKKVDELECIDEESGAMHFGRFFVSLRETFSRSHRLGDSFSLVLLDIEKYAEIIKIYGIEIAKEVLRELVEEIKTKIRQYDSLCRFGADELLLSLPGTSLEEAKRVSEKILQLVSATKFTKHNLTISLFIGVANFPENAKSIDGLITAAKNALLNAKRAKEEIRIGETDHVYD